jgi:membrane-bound lytic murein transglycosylase
MSSEWTARVDGVGEVAEQVESSRDAMSEARRNASRHCGWCGRRLEQRGSVGRRRRYCGQSCRQRAYERRSAVQRSGLPEDAVVLSDTEIATLQDRLFQLRCAAEDVVTAADDGADAGELKRMAGELAKAAHDLEQLR